MPYEHEEKRNRRKTVDLLSLFLRKFEIRLPDYQLEFGSRLAADKAHPHRTDNIWFHLGHRDEKPREKTFCLSTAFFSGVGKEKVLTESP